MDLLDTLTSRLKDLMREKGVKAAPLARSANLNESAVRDILRGRSKNPGIVTLQKIASVMDLRPSALYEGGHQWRVDGVLQQDGALESPEHYDMVPTSIENPFYHLGTSVFSAVYCGDFSAAPIGYPGDYLIFDLEAEGDPKEFAGKPCLCTLADGRRVVRIVALGDEPGRVHLAPLNIHVSAVVNAAVERAAPIVFSLPGRLVPSAEVSPATHRSTTTLQEEQAAFEGPRG